MYVVDAFDPDVSWLQTIHEVSGKPVMVGEFSFTAVDSNMPNTRGTNIHEILY